MPPPPGSFRVVVVQPARDAGLSGDAAASALAEHIALPEDARIALEAGRSAVIRSEVTERYARRVATQVMKLGFEVRIEPEENGVAPHRDMADPWPGATTPTVANPPPPMPGPGLASGAEASLGRGDDTVPVLMDRPHPWDDGPGSAALSGTDDPPMEAHPLSSGPDGPTGAGGPDLALPGSGEGSGAGTRTGEREAGARAGEREAADSGSIRLVRCPAHGLLYDASKSNGCSRCVGGTSVARSRLLPTLRSRPRLWLATGVLLALGLGAVPAVIYAQQVKSGSLLEQRIKAEAIRLGRADNAEGRAAYLEATAQVNRTRANAMAITALIWLASSVFLLLLYRRFV